MRRPTRLENGVRLERQVFRDAQQAMEEIQVKWRISRSAHVQLGGSRLPKSGTARL